jgi:hypothetical protein
MKRFLIILSVIIVLIIGALIVLPFLFKDDIKAAIDREISRNVHAEVYFDTDKVGITFFKNFPNITLTLKEFGIVGVETFDGDTLAAIDAFDITVDLKSLIFGDQIAMKSVNLVNPRIFILVTENGLANYDVLIEKEDQFTDNDTEENNNLSISIDSWNIMNGKLVYYDYSNNFLLALDEIDHSGSGDFSMDVFDLNTSTTIERMMISYEDVEYLKNKKLVADIILNIDLDNQKYTFRENIIYVNDLNFGFDGFVEMLSDHYNIDLSFQGNKNSVKSIVSLIPGAYKENFKDIQAAGLLDFKGYVKGKFNEAQKQNPAFNINMSSNNGSIQYPDLPDAIQNIRFNLDIINKTGEINQTAINLENLHLDLGKNPFDASIKINNLKDYEVDATLKTTLDLDDVEKIYSMEGTDMSGKLDADIVVKGVYDTVHHTIPVSGNLQIVDLNYTSQELPQGFGITSSDVVLNTESIKVNNFKGNIGNSDLNFSGYLTNYIEYIIHGDAILKGEFDFSSEIVDLNEWTISEEGKEIDEEDTSGVEVIKIPADLDFVLESRIEKVLYDNLELNDFRGQLIVRNEAIHLNKVGFNALGGLFTMDGMYDTKDEDHPKFDFDFSIKDLSIPESYNHFMTIRMLAPVSKIMEGNFSTDFKMSGDLKKNLTPDLRTISGEGILHIVNATIRGSESKVIAGITQVSKLANKSLNADLYDVLLESQIENGKVYTQPFNVKIGESNALFAGSSGLDGSIDYNIKLDVPPKAIQTAGSLISSFTGKDISVNDKDVKMNLKVEGKFTDPKISIMGVEMGESGKAAEDELKAIVEAEKEKAIEEGEKILEAEKEKAIEEGEKILEEEQEKAPEEVQKVLEEHEEEIDKAKNLLKDFFKKDGGGKP